MGSRHQSSWSRMKPIAWTVAWQTRQSANRRGVARFLGYMNVVEPWSQRAGFSHQECKRFLPARSGVTPSQCHVIPGWRWHSLLCFLSHINIYIYIIMCPFSFLVLSFFVSSFVKICVCLCCSLSLSLCFSVRHDSSREVVFRRLINLRLCNQSTALFVAKWQVRMPHKTLLACSWHELLYGFLQMVHIQHEVGVDT